MLDLMARKKVSRLVDPFARAAARIGLTPASITLLGLALSIAGAVLIAFGRLVVGAAVLGFGALLDVLDGVLARLTGTETRRGAVLDSFTDRLGEVAMWTGLVYYLGTRPEPTLVMLSVVAVCGSLLVPFLRAKAESDGLEGRSLVPSTRTWTGFQVKDAKAVVFEARGDKKLNVEKDLGSYSGPVKGEYKREDETIAVNRRARHDYAISDKYEAGLVLTGTEVKSLREGQASLVDGFAAFDNADEAASTLAVLRHGGLQPVACEWIGPTRAMPAKVPPRMRSQTVRLARRLRSHPDLGPRIAVR